MSTKSKAFFWTNWSRSGDSSRSLQDGLLHVATQACDILVHTNHGDVNWYDRGSVSNGEQLVMLISGPSGVPAPGASARRQTNVLSPVVERRPDCKYELGPDETEFELWDSRFSSREDPDTEVGFSHARLGPCSWCKPSCIPITVILILIVLVVLVPLLNQTESTFRTSPSHHPISELCLDDCYLGLVESIPEGLEYKNTSAKIHPSTYEAWKSLINSAQAEIIIVSFYWTLRDIDVVRHPSSKQGETIFQSLIEAGQRGVSLKIVQSLPTSDPPTHDTLVLQRKAKAQVRTLNLPRLLGGGVLHTKLWLIDGHAFYLGSANQDWRALTQVKELGIVGRNCSCLVDDFKKIFSIYWQMATPGSTIPSEWPSQLDTKYNLLNPMNVSINGTQTSAYISSAPPPFNPLGRSDDLSAILSIILKAEQFIHIAVMDYLPLTVYTEQIRFWPIIDDALRTAAINRRISIRMLVGSWNHTRPAMYKMLHSLQDISDSYLDVNIQVKRFVVPYTPDQSKIPFARVSHNKYMVTDNTAYIGTSNWSGDYFLDTAGIGFVTSHETLRQELEDVFDRDFNSEFAKDLP